MDNFGFDESKSREYADWKRVRAAIEHENLLINHRLTWLFSSQAFLLTAYTLAFNKWSEVPANAEARQLFPILLFTIAGFAILISFLIRSAVKAAVTQLNHLDDWWHLERESRSLHSLTQGLTRESRKEREEKLLSDHPPLQGRSPTPWNDRFAQHEIPSYFISAWVLIIAFMLFFRFGQTLSALSKNAFLLGLTLLFGLVLLLVYLVRKYKKKNRKLREALNAANRPM